MNKEITVNGNDMFPGNTNEEAEKQHKSIGYWSAAWRRFKQNKMALISGGFIAILLIVTIITPLIAPYMYDEPHYENSLEGPSLKFLFGTDEHGRDMFSRVLYSMRNAMIVAFGAQSLSLIIGTILGAIAGFRGKLIDAVIMRVVDIMYAFPVFLFSVIVVTVLGPGLFTIFISLGFFFIARISPPDSESDVHDENNRVGNK